MTADSENEFELITPDSLCRGWWLIVPTPFVEMTPEEIEARRAEMAPEMFSRLDSLGRQRRKILSLLKKSNSPEDRRHLLSALDSLRRCVSITLEMICDWGLTRPEQPGLEKSVVGRER